MGGRSLWLFFSYFFIFLNHIEIRSLLRMRTAEVLSTIKDESA